MPHSTSIMASLGHNDSKHIRRDSFLTWMIFYPLMTALVVRFLVPWIATVVADYIDLAEYHALIVSYICVLVPPMLMGTVIGFLLIDERDQQTLPALLVTPMPLNIYLLYRVLIPMGLSVVLTAIAVPLTGLVVLPVGPLLLVALAMSLYAAIVALFFAGFADNKIQGFALMKIVGTIAMLPVAAYFVPAPWDSLIGLVFPPYWAPAPSGWLRRASRGMACCWYWA
ncbi:MAG: hypothetical protein HC837_03125 [Chloroflexaceae bacterium]|nr:hypothetical protein [Chloroflexaceae bacterium]